MQTYRVIFHIDESYRQRAEQTLANITNLLDDMGEDNLEVELLANGSGVQMVKKDAGHEEAGMIVSAGITSRRLSTLRVVEVLREL